MQVCFLLLDVYLLQQLADKAAEVLAFLERMFATLTKSVDKPGENGKYLYPAIKRWSHTVEGLPVQCCQVTKA